MSAPSPPRSRPRRLNGAQRREQLLDAAEDLAATEGIAALTMERVSERAQVSKPVVYSHFDNSPALLLALLERSWARLDRRVATRLKHASTVDEQIVAIVDGYFDAIAEAGPLLHQLIVNESQEPTVEEVRIRRLREAEAQWSRVYQTKWRFPSPVADILAALLRGSLENAAGYWLRGEHVSRDLCVNACLTVIRSTLAAASESYRSWV